MKNNNHNVEEWVERADKDLELAKHIFDEGWNWEYVCYFCEQAVEKHLKAFIVQVKGNITKRERTHNLIDLSRLCKNLGLDLSGLEQSLRMLSQFYTPTRYPVPEAEKYKREDAEQALQYTKRIIERVKKVLK